MTNIKYTNDYLITTLKTYYEKYKKIPTKEIINKNVEYPSQEAYISHFGSWSAALKAAGLDTDTMFKNGTLKLSDLSTNQQKARIWELCILKSFKNEGMTDLSGQNCNSPFDGICPKQFTYDAKSSKRTLLNKGRGSTKGWIFGIGNKEIKKIQYLFLGAFNEDYSRLLHAWMMPIRAACIEKNGNFYIKSNIKIPDTKYGLNKWKCYEISNNCLSLDEIPERIKRH